MSGVGTHTSWTSPRSSNLPKTDGVESPSWAVATTQVWVAGVGTGTRRSPRPVPRATPPMRQKGTSDPSWVARSCSSSAEASNPQATEQASSAPAASAEPPAIPPATGIVLSMCRSTPRWGWRRVQRNRSAARTARFVRSSGTSSASSPLVVTVMASSVRTVAVTTSCSPMASNTVASGW